MSIVSFLIKLLLVMSVAAKLAQGDVTVQCMSATQLKYRHFEFKVAEKPADPLSELLKLLLASQTTTSEACGRTSGMGFSLSLEGPSDWIIRDI